MENQFYQNIRALCAEISFSVIDNGVSLNVALSSKQQALSNRDRALVQEICFGIMRVLPELNFYVHSLMDKVLTGKNRILHHLLLVGIYQIIYTRIPEHAAVGETVSAVNYFKKTQFKGLINGVLREFLRQKESLKQKFTQHDEQQSLHPRWLLNRIKQAYPNEWQAIIKANNQKPPMWLRINQNCYTTTQYQQKLAEQEIESESVSASPTALKLTVPVNVNKLPSFDDGAVTIQDLSAQYAASLLAPKNGEQILDLCAAPGGKTTHILEIAPKANLLAVDIDSSRVKRIDENLKRLKLNATVKIGDGMTPEKWCNGLLFDRILFDAPCSATGVIRRHPDIKWLRRENDIAELVSLQQSILTAIWPYLKQGGRLVYSTCSILPDENQAQISHFLEYQSDASLDGEMMQILPTENGGDGFFYAILKKM